MSPETIDKFDQALSLPDDIVKAAHLAPPLDKANPVDDARDNTAERLLVRVAKDDTAPDIAEALLTTLAYEFADGQFRDIHTAYVSLRRALEAAEDIRKRGEMPEGNTGGQLNAVMAEVAKLNNKGQLDEADALLDAEERRMREAHKAEKDRLDQQRANLLVQRLDQDRLRNRPDLAAGRLIRDLRQTPQVGGLFWAINVKANEWTEEGDRSGDIFALNTALELAKANYDRAKAKSVLAAAALHTLAMCHFRLAERSSNDRHLTVAHNASEAAVKKTSKTKNPLHWSSRQDGLGLVLREMGERAAGPVLLRRAADCHRAALDVAILQKSENQKVRWNNLGNALQKLGELTRDPIPLAEAVSALQTALSLKDRQADRLGWELTQSNLALAQRWLGDVTDDPAMLTRARQGYAACEALEYRDDAPFVWAKLQWNIADLALARHRLTPDPALLAEARDHVTAARGFFVDGSDYQTQRCDDLLAKIAEAAGPA